MMNINKPWNSDTKHLFEKLSSSEKGLTNAIARERLSKFGFNEISDQNEKTLLKIIINQFRNILVVILLIVALISILTDHPFDALVIFIVLIFNAAIGVYQESRAEKSIRSLKKLLTKNVTVIRDGEEKIISSNELVIGDIIKIKEGDKIPADGRIVSCQDFMVIESNLTGESVPVEKSIDVVEENVGIGDQKNMAFSSTSCVNGKAIILVTATGYNTVIGRLADKIVHIKSSKTHFDKITSNLVKVMTLIAFTGAVIIFISGVFIQNLSFREIFFFTISILVSAIPEGLPAVLTVVLSIGAFKMAKRQAIVRNLSSIETLSIVDTILTDKTGTLTQNTMMIKRVLLSDRTEFEVTGSGFSTKGEIQFNDKKIDVQDYNKLYDLIQKTNFSVDANLIKNGNNYDIVGDPTEASFKVLYEKSGIESQGITIVKDFSFSSEFKVRSTILQSDQIKHYENIIIGAPENILSFSDFYQDKRSEKISDEFLEFINHKITDLSKKGFRVIGVAKKEIDKPYSKVTHKILSGYTFIGIVAMYDPPREEVRDAINLAESAGIRVVMLTGDHIETASAIAKAVGIDNFEMAIDDKSLEKLSEDEFSKAVRLYNVFARLSPESKLRVAKELQKQGRTIAMTGDGVNDSLALKQADIGISMGITGTDLAKEASDIVLRDDNFVTIINAIEEGRIVFNNIRKAATYLVTTSVAELLTILLTIILGLPLPLLPIQILWLNLVTDGVNGVALSTEKSHGTALKKKPRSRNENILTRSTIKLTIFISAIMMSLTMVFFLYGLNQSEEKARTLAFLIMSFTQIFNVLNLRSFTKPLSRIGFFTNKNINLTIFISIILNFVAIYFQPVRDLLGFVDVSISEFVSAFLFSSLVLIIFETYKFAKNRV